MGVLRPDPAPHRVHTVHRLGAGSVGAFLAVFGVVVLTRVPEFVSTTGTVVMGLAGNGLLATISLVVGAVLLGSAVRGGRAASTTALVVGVLFLASGLGNALVLDTAVNMLGFELSNVVFSVAVGCALVLLGAYGRISGGLPPGPYTASRGGTPELPYTGTLPGAGVDRALAAAERAVATRTASAEQADRVRAAAAFRTHEDRRRAYARNGSGPR